MGGPVATHMKCCPAHLNSCPTSTRTMNWTAEPGGGSCTRWFLDTGGGGVLAIHERIAKLQNGDCNPTLLSQGTSDIAPDDASSNVLPPADRSAIRSPHTPFAPSNS